MKYYSIHRPIQPGGYPRRLQPETITNFDARQFCEEIGRDAWGYIEYPEPLTEKEISDYELTPAGRKLYWCVTSAFDDHGKVIAAITDCQEFDEKPKNSNSTTSRKDIYNDWFESEEEAQKFVDDAKNA